MTIIKTALRVLPVLFVAAAAMADDTAPKGSPTTQATTDLAKEWGALMSLDTALQAEIEHLKNATQAVINEDNQIHQQMIELQAKNASLEAQVKALQPPQPAPEPPPK